MEPEVDYVDALIRSISLLIFSRKRTPEYLPKMHRFQAVCVDLDLRTKLMDLDSNHADREPTMVISAITEFRTN